MFNALLYNMGKPTQRDKIAMYEAFLHKINMYVTCSNNEGIRKLIKRADNWSYAHRCGNGEYTDKEQQMIIDTAFWKLLD